MKIVFAKQDGVGMGATHPKLAPLPFLVGLDLVVIPYRCKSLTHLDPLKDTIVP